MKISNGARRLVALTLATSVAIPVTSPAFAASLEIGKTAETHLRSIIDTTKTDKPSVKLLNESGRIILARETTKPDLPTVEEELLEKDTEWDPTLTTEVDKVEPPEGNGEMETQPPAPVESTVPEEPVPLPSEEGGETTEPVTPEDPKGELPEGDIPQTPPLEEDGEKNEGIPEEDPLPEQSVPPDEGVEGEVSPPQNGEMEALPPDAVTEEQPGEEEQLFAAPQSDPVFDVYQYYIGYGVKVGALTNQSIEEYNREFRVELSSMTKDVIESGQTTEYGQVLYSGRNMLYVGDPVAGMQSFCIFPSEDMLGRVPDRQFAGWYLYHKGTKSADDPSIYSWHYEDNVSPNPKPVEAAVEDYGPGALGYKEHGDKGDTWDGGANYSEYGYKTMTENGRLLDDPVSFVGRWELSDESRAAKENGATLTVSGRDTPLVLYGSDINGVPASELKTLATEFDRNKTEYWLRVDADVDTLDLDFNAYEIFYSYHNAKAEEEIQSPVQVFTVFQGQETLYDIVSHEMLPKPTNPSGMVNIPSNSVDNPAHSNWKVDGITIQPSVGTSGLYNDVTVEVTSPSGKETTTYTFHVQRMTEPTMRQNPGNTPFGMIERDASGQWGSSTTEIATNKQAAKDYFEEHYKFSTSNQLYPHDDQNNGGSIFRERYSPKAWEAYGTNVDMDSEAIVVYQNSAFLDPGIAVTDAEGKKITVGQNGYIVERSLQLRTASQLSISAIGDGVGTPCWYQDGELVTSENAVWETLDQAAGRDQIDLRGLHVLPGIYTLEYRYTDPYLGKTYGSDGDAFVTESGQAGKENFRRTVVVLPMPGDVDMDGMVTSADAVALSKGLGVDPLLGPVFNGKALDKDSTAALFTYRVGNGDWDDDMGQDDVDLLEALPHPQLISASNASNSDYYYIPLPTGDNVDREERKPLTLAAEGEVAPKLELVYLGKESGSRQPDGYTSNPTGPWTTDIDSATGIILEDTFWMGVRLTGGEVAELLKKDVDTFTLTLTYDARYLEPATVLSQEQWTQAGSAAGRWNAMMQYYNLSRAQTQTVWGQFNYGLTAAADNASPFTVDGSKAVTPLEKNAEQNTQLTSLVFSVSLLENGSPVNWNLNEDQSVWLFAVPFTLVSHPVGQETAQLVEMGAGMSEFTLVFADGTAAAYHNIQETIFGGATANLKTAVAYANAGPEIPLGEDKSEYYYIFNDHGSGSSADDIVYATPFVAAYKWRVDEEGNRTMLSESEGPSLPYQGKPRNLPNWLTYDGANQRLSGTPTASGTYDFTIAGEHFRLVVEKAPLHYWADNQSSYYGQEEFRGKDNNQFTFRYAAEDIMFLEADRATESGGTIKVDGDGAGLKALLNDPKYQAPRFTAVEGEGLKAKPVTGATHASEQAYSILSDFGDGLKAGSSNYDLIYTPDRAGGSQGFTVLRRPFLIQQITAGTNVNDNATDAEGNRYMIYSDRTNGVVTNVHAKLGDGGSGFSVQLMPKLDNDPEGFYNGLPLTAKENYTGGVLLPDDSLEILYQAELLQTEEDLANVSSGVGHFTLQGPEEERVAYVSAMSVVDGANAGNYYLASPTPLTNRAEAGVVGTVTRRNVREFHIIQTPPLKYQYGDQLSRSNDLRFNIVKDGIIEEGTYPYNEETTFAQHGITVTWATEEEKAAKQIGSLEYHTGQTFTVDYNGRYLCLSTEIVDETAEDGKRLLTTYWTQPLEVTPRTLTLTAVPVRRYYGEENGTLSFTYDARQLSVADQQRLVEHFGGSSGNSARDGKELMWLFSDDEEAVKRRGCRQDYKAPALSAWEYAAEKAEERGAELQATTPYTGAINAVMIEGAACNNYAFEYVYTDRTGSTTRQEKWGAGEYRIERRPIVVDALRETTATTTLATMYADTKQIYTEKLPLTMNDVVLALPEHTETTSSYFPRNGVSGNTAPTIQIGYADGATPVVNGDKLFFTYTATMVSQDGEDYVKWTDFSKGHFNMESAGEDGAKRYAVQVSNLQLVTAESSDSNNYVLVFRDNTSAVQALPARYAPEAGIEPGVSADKFYYVPWIVNEVGGERAGTGEVRLRPIANIEILSTGKLDYIYGESYFPSQPGGSDNRGMRVALHYVSGKDAPYENYEGNVTSEVVTFGISHYEAGKPVTTFDDRSLVIYWSTEGTTDVDEDHLLPYQQYLTVSPYDGAQIFVAGKRGGQSETVRSQLSTDRLQVGRRPLTLTAVDMRRCYGEENGTPSFTFDMDQLTEQDRNKLIAAGLTGADGSVALAKLGFAYTAPTMTTTANARSNVINGGQGGYPIVISGGELANYRFEYERGTLYIYPRMLQITGLESSASKPIYTIFSNTSRREFDTNVQSDRVDTKPRPNHISDTVTLPVTEGKGGILAGDTITLKVTVAFNQNLVNGAQSVQVINAELIPGGSAGNYELEQTGSGAAITNREAIGMVQNRSIDRIEIVTQPSAEALSYTYGDPLDLSNLVVKIYYSQMEGESETGQNRDVPFLGTDQFAENGLYLHYYDSDQLPAKNVWGTLNTNNSAVYRTAATGDHVTIAPTHDTQGGRSEFSANGKYLIVSAQLEGQEPIQPIILSNRVQVSPLPLTFALAAEGKTYDGTNQAAGTLTLSNVYQQAGYVDAYNRNGVTDQIYPVTGAAYEESWGSLNGSFTRYLTEHGGYVFSTGTYTRSGELDLEENRNYAIQWTDGYDPEGSGILRFAFADPNVAYAQTPSHDSYGLLAPKQVHVTGLKLAGPDAANYTIAGIACGETGSVTADNVGNLPLSDYAQGALPQAVIYKANRAKLPTDILPQVEVDPHTNVVRVVYHQSESVLEKGEKDTDIHFEYALQYEKTEDDTTSLYRWAGADGNDLWDDGRYFGGETVAVELPEGYIPRGEDIPKGGNGEKTVKGQVYAWAEEDRGFTLNEEAYPGGEAWEGYTLYQTERTSLPRDAVFLPLVRAAETHNYNASPVLSAVESYTPEKFQELLDRETAVNQAANEAELQAARQALTATTEEIRALVEEAVQAARQAALDEKTALEASGEGNSGSSNTEVPGIPQGPAVKTYQQRIDTVSTKELRSADAQNGDKAFEVPTLEAVWFTDVLEYPSKAVLDAVLRNRDPVRYYDYGWDSKRTTKLNFEKDADPISFAGDLWIDFTKTQEGQEETGAWVNRDHIARIYVDTTAPSGGGSSGRVERITIDSGDIVASVGDEPRKLTVIIEPTQSQDMGVRWTSSDPSVVKVSQGGVLTFVGIGTAVITATAGGVSDSITVVVTESWLSRYPGSIFDFNELEAFFPMGEDMLFHPEWEMSRGETAMLLVRLYQENPDWKRKGPKDFPDLTGEEDYAEAARLLGSLGVMIGVENGDFDGERSITRAEFITLLVRMIGVSIPDTKGQPYAFLDTGEEDTWAYAEIDAMANSRAGVLLGVGEGYFAPGRNITRAEAVTFLNRLLRFQKPAGEEIRIPLDVEEEHWARDPAIRAVNRGNPLIETEEKKKP